jgi:hypothetical protein
LLDYLFVAAKKSEKKFISNDTRFRIFSLIPDKHGKKAKRLVQIQTSGDIKMKIKLNLVITILAVLVFGNLVMAQDDRTSTILGSVPNLGFPKIPTLPCCRCLGGVSSLDLRTVPGNPWTVNGNPVAFPTPINTGWTLDPGTAQWVSTNINGSANSVPPGTYEYRLEFNVPFCTIDQEITLSGYMGGDNDVYIYLDNYGNLLTSCTNNECFKASSGPINFSAPIAPGLHTLIVRVFNQGGPSGMFVNATLTGKCSTKLTK